MYSCAKLNVVAWLHRNFFFVMFLTVKAAYLRFFVLKFI